MLVVEGAIVNVQTRNCRIRITLLDSRGRPLQEELLKSKEQHLEPGAKTSFCSSIVPIPANGGTNFSISFRGSTAL